MNISYNHYYKYKNTCDYGVRLKLSIIKILICDKISEKGINLLRGEGYDISYLPTLSPENLLSSVSGYNAVIVRSRTQITKEVIFAGKNLKVIGRAGVGLDNIDLKAAKDAGIIVYNTPDALTNAVAELVFGLMLSLSRGICIGDSNLKQGKWLKSQLKGFELKDKVLGIIGLGRIGKRVSAIASAFGMKVLFNDVIEIPKKVIEQLNIEFTTVDDVLAKSDYITLNIPFTPATKHYISKKELSKMKKTAYLINASRGAVVDEKALLESLMNNDIQGAALDVFEIEPPKRNDLLLLPNVVCTPHIGAQTKEAQEVAATEISKMIIKYFNSN
ncbi:hydroxyacid dehydrogenase [Thermoproteota archaeon]